MPLQLKPRRKLVPASSGTRKYITFLDPGYRYGANLLFRLPAVDVVINEGEEGCELRRGIHAETARIACAILANCR